MTKDTKQAPLFKYKRVILKLSGASLANPAKGLSIDYEKVSRLTGEIKFLKKFNIQVGIVVGAGNFWRGASATRNGIPRNRADYVGMLATLMNGLAIESVFTTAGIKTRVMSALGIDPKIAQPYVNEVALKLFESGHLLIFAGGTGRPFFTTDTAATLLASELQADLVLLAKNNTDGVYDKDPNVYKDAKHYACISYDQILENNLKFMDLTATSMAKSNKLKLIVFDICRDKPISRTLTNKLLHTKVGF